jgi:hypothetical protein
MRKRPSIDLMSLTSEAAVTMPEAAQRSAHVAPPKPSAATTSANLEGLAFKVSPEFRRRFRQSAAAHDLKLNELLFAAFDAWEREQVRRG